MTPKIELSSALNIYVEARKLYQEENFLAASELSKQYRNNIQYDAFPKTDSRDDKQISVSVVIVAYGGRDGLIDCLESLVNQNDQDFEIILVDNGNNERIHLKLQDYPMLHIHSPVNLHWTEGRNLGAHFARGRFISFIDDDGILDGKYISNVKAAWRQFNFLAVRGRIRPKSKFSNQSVAGHYDYGEYPIPAILMAEGNMAIEKDVFKAVGGFDPLVLGGEGLELTHRLLKQYPGRDIYYWPGLLMYHDFVKGKNMLAKKKRHSITQAYFNFLAPEINQMQRIYSDWYKARSCEGITYDRRSLLDKISAKLQEKAIRWINRFRH